MSKVQTVEIQCSNPNCRAWFPSPIFFGDLNSFDSSMLIGNTVSCPVCRKMVDCNKENMRVRGKDGGFKGNETV